MIEIDISLLDRYTCN